MNVRKAMVIKTNNDEQMERQSDLFQEIKVLSQKEYEGTLNEREFNRLQELLSIREVEILNRLYAGFIADKRLIDEFLAYMDSGLVDAYSDLFAVDLNKRRNFKWQ